MNVQDVMALVPDEEDADSDAMGDGEEAVPGSAYPADVKGAAGKKSRGAKWFDRDRVTLKAKQAMDKLIAGCVLSFKKISNELDLALKKLDALPSGDQLSCSGEVRTSGA
eukprot:5067752-Pyramimonas_sp.AAC.1